MSEQEQGRRLLIVEDDEGLQRQLRWHFEGYEVLQARDRESALAELRRAEPAVVLQDLGLPPDEEGVDEGFRCVQEILSLKPNTKVIVVTGHHETRNAMRAIALGACDFYQKPVDTDVLDLIVQRAFHIHALEEQNRRLSNGSRSPLDGVIAGDNRMLATCRMIEKIAPTNVTCLLLGESGTGKEVLARAIHDLSPRAGEAFVAINCAAVPETLMESELFGYEKGAFTGAHKRMLGKVESASGGTLFLDEIGDMPLPLQAKMLRFLQQRVIDRVGGREEIPVDVRVVCATNKNLEQMVREGNFREDLFYRISEIVVEIPALRERTGDKVLLARHFVTQFAREHNPRVSGLGAEAAEAIEAYAWPGNIREMQNRIKRAVIMSDGRQLTVEDLALPGAAGQSAIPLNLREVRQAAETSAINRALALSDGNISQAAKLLGITRPTLYDLMSKYGMETGLSGVVVPD
jgi:two-component system NtrC family response regulator